MDSLSPTLTRFSPIRGLGRFVPPAARRPATAIPALLVILTLAYMLCSRVHPITPLYAKEHANEEAVVESHRPDLGPLQEEYRQYFGSEHLPEILSQDPSTYKLSERLAGFLNRPVLSHEEAKESMRVHCPLEVSDKLVNPDQYNGDSEFWKNEVTKQVITEKRAKLVTWLAGKAEQGEKIVWENGLGTGRGSVMTAGNKDTAARLIFQLRHLKQIGSTLPVEVFHYPGEMTNQKQRSEIESLGATIREVQGIHKTEGAWKNWQLKGLSLVQSSFQEILSLDSDNAPLRDPSHLFDATIYTLNGRRAVFWPDLSKDHPDNAIWRIIGEACTLDDWTFETGQFVIDKSGNDGLNLAALWMVSGMLDDEDRSFWFKMCGGDKDTFRWAFRALDLDFGRSPRWMSSVGIMDGDQYCGHTVLQYDLVTEPGEDRPRPLFAHSNLLKHLRAHGLGRGHLFTHTKRLSLDTYSLKALNYAHQWVKFGSRGMCLDIDWHPLANERLSEAEKEEFEIRVVPVGDVEGGVFEGFEDSFFDLGGKAGGW